PGAGQQRGRRLPVRRRRPHPRAPGSLGPGAGQPLRPGRGRAGPALVPPRHHPGPGARRTAGRQPGRPGRRQPGWHPPRAAAMVQPAPALFAMTHRSGPSEYTAMRPTRIHVLYLATAATLALAAGAGAQERDALPQDGRVVAGKADLARHERSLTITQHSQRAILEWRSFDIGADAAVHFVQPDASAVVLNRVLGGQPSRIAGRLSGNGHVYLVNAAGVLFAPGAQVDVGRLVSTGLDIADSEFMASDGRFDQAAPEGLLPMAPGAGNPPLPLRVADPQAEDAEPPRSEERRVG